MSSLFSSSLPNSNLSIQSDSSLESNGSATSSGSNNNSPMVNKQVNQLKGGNKELKNSFNGISSGIDKISLYSKDINCILACDVNREREIQEAEQLFENLPELVYNVTKINQWGKHQKRNLKLTNKGIENIRNGDFVSSLYYYSDIKSIYNKDSETFVIEYKNAAHNYIYRSSIGYQIVQEISSRLKLKHATEKKKSGFDIAMEFQKKFLHTKRLSEKIQVTALLDINQMDLNSNNNPSHSSSSVSPKTPPSTTSKKSSSSSANSMSRSSSFENYSTGDDGSSVSSSPSSPTNCSNIDYDDYDEISQQNNKQAKRVTKVSQLLGTTEEQRVQSEVDKIILSPQSSERKSIQQFMSNFNVLLKNPATATMIIRQFLDSTRQNILNEYKDIAKVMVVPNSPNSPNNFSNSTGSLPGINTEEIDISTIVEKSLEKAIILRSNKQINQIISQQVQKDEAILQDNISKLCTKSQAFFGIQDEFISSNNWKYAILELSCLGRCEIPHDKLQTILASAKAIYNTINYEKNIRNKDQQDYFISADDFLPIYLYVVVNSGVKELEFTNQYLWQLSDPEKLGGEGGYYLTVFSSTLSLIKTLNMEAIERASIIDDLIPSIQLKEDIQPPIPIPTNNNNINNNSRNNNPLHQSNDSFGSWTGGRVSAKKERNQSFNFGDKSFSDKSK